MAILDSLLEFADAQTVATAAGTTLLPNQIDRQGAQLDFGAGKPIYLVINVSTAIVTGGSAGTLHFRLVSDDTASIHATTSSCHLETPRFVTDDDPTIPVGTQLFCSALPHCVDHVSYSVAGVPVTTGPGARYERYLGLQFVVTTTTITAGAVNAFLTYDPMGWRAYADAVN